MGLALPEQRQRRQTVHDRHVEVQDHDIGIAGAHHRKGLLAVGGFAADHKLGVHLQDEPAEQAQVFGVVN